MREGDAFFAGPSSIAVGPSVPVLRDLRTPLRHWRDWHSLSGAAGLLCRRPERGDDTDGPAYRTSSRLGRCDCLPLRRAVVLETRLRCDSFCVCKIVADCRVSVPRVGLVFRLAVSSHPDVLEDVPGASRASGHSGRSGVHPGMVACLRERTFGVLDYVFAVADKPGWPVEQLDRSCSGAVFGCLGRLGQACPDWA